MGQTEYTCFRLTQGFDFYWLATVEFCHALDLGEGDIIVTLKAMTSLIQTGHHTSRVLENRDIPLWQVDIARLARYMQEFYS